MVPGQGSFGPFCRALEGGLDAAILEHLQNDRPFLGICLGMQALFAESDEAPGARGLGFFEGRVRRFAADMRDPEEPERRLKVPHMGWNVVDGTHPLLAPKEYFYFVHSYYCDPIDASLRVGECTYGIPFCAALARGSLFACQFHPEKSQRAGALLLERFVEGSWS